MYCPECGTEAGDAKYCPECGADLSSVRAARGAKAAGKKPAASAGPQARPEPKRGPSAALLWGLIGLVAVAVVVVVLVTQLSGDSGGGTVDTSGSYGDLVSQANDLYDQGDAAFTANDIEGGAKLFGEAAQLYTAAWKKQPGDPNVGTDYATALFYSGDIEAAVKQIDVVLKADPTFQTGWFNKGNYLAHEARITEQMGRAKDAAKLYKEARQAYLKAVALDPKSEVGKESQNRIKDLPD